MRPSLLLFPLLLSLGCRVGDKGGQVDTGGLGGSPGLDEDGDGFAADEDCDDQDASINPGAAERCDQRDNDCDGEIDEGDAEDAVAFYRDGDSDGYGDPEQVQLACSPPDASWVDNDADCDDSQPTAWPGAPERCDGLDNDCDGEIDEEVQTTWYTDGDADGYGDPDLPVESCDPPDDAVAEGTDCNDRDPASYPGAVEICDEFDNDCDGSVDEGVTTAYYLDADLDLWGDAAFVTEACTPPLGYAARSGDCDDAETAVNPDATELCDLIDNDCDGAVDEDDAADAGTWYVDADGDGQGDATRASRSCNPASGTVSDDRDCDDSDATVYTGAPERWDDLDNDCDGSADNGLYAGTGADGALTVTGSTDLSVDASNGRSVADAVSYGISGINGASLTLNEAPAGLAVGDEVLVINLQGSSGAHASVGAHEFATVAAVGALGLDLSRDLVEIYGETDNSDLSDQVVVVQRVPNYSDVAVSATGSLSTGAWNGAGGGVLAFRAAGTLSVASGGSVSVAALGFAGGATGGCNNCDAYQGESYGGLGIGGYYGGPYNQANGGYAANLGGGGANVTGGGGNHGGGATAGASWNGGSYTAPAAGSSYGDANLTAIYLGSGGGGVWNGGNDNPGENPGPGGNGGGVLYIGASTIDVDGADGLLATGGSTAYWAWGTWTYGAGGGAGGSIFLVADTVDLATGSVNASGGLGESSHVRIGGNGGYGRVRIDCSTCNGATQGSTSASSALADASAPDPGASSTPW